MESSGTGKNIKNAKNGNINRNANTNRNTNSKRTHTVSYVGRELSEKKQKRLRKIRRRKHRRRKLRLWGVTAAAFLLMLWGISAEGDARKLPDYPKVNIEKYLDQEKLTKEDYELLFQQTGLASPGVDALRREGRQKELLILQEKLFAQVPITCRANTILTREERIAENGSAANRMQISVERAAEKLSTPQPDPYACIPYVEEGDILITFNSHAFGWRNGHAAMVVDAEGRKTLEARVLGSNTEVMSMEHWTSYPSFVILRLKSAAKEERKAIADLAVGQLEGVPYRLTAGWKDRILAWWKGEQQQRQTEDAAALNGTQCAHLIWYAYELSGYDLDSDGGLLVTPRDLYGSPLLEVVQVYGIPIVP